MKVAEVRKAMETVVRMVRKLHKKHGDLSKQDSRFKAKLKVLLPDIHSKGLRRALELCFLHGPNSAERQDQSHEQRVILTKILREDVYCRDCSECGQRLASKSFWSAAYIGADFCSRKCMASNEGLKKKREATCLERYGSTNPMKNSEIRAKADKTVLQRFGVTNVSQSAAVKTRKATTCQSNYGVDNPSLSKEVVRKRTETFIERFGVSNPLKNEIVKQRSRDTCVERYGMETTGGYSGRIKKMKESLSKRTKAQKAESNVRREATNMERYGVAHCMHSEEMARKSISSAFRTKEVKISGTKFSGLLGYEPAALDFLLKQGVKPSSIKCGRRAAGSFPFVFMNKTRVYYPDFQLNGVYVEVKSTYTAGLEGQRGNEGFDFLKKKLKAVEAARSRIYCMVQVRKSQWLIIQSSLVTRRAVMAAINVLKADSSLPFLLVGDPSPVRKPA